MAAEFRDDFARQVWRKREVVAGGDEEHRTRADALEAWDEGHRADGQEVFAQLVQGHGVAEACADVLCGDAAPGDIRDVAGAVIEDAHRDSLVVRVGEESHA